MSIPDTVTSLAGLLAYIDAEKRRQRQAACDHDWIDIREWAGRVIHSTCHRCGAIREESR